MCTYRIPLNNLLPCSFKWNWTPEHQIAFESIQSILSSSLVLTQCDRSLDIIVATDASEYEIAAVILYWFQDGSQKVIGNAFMSVTPAEQHYSQFGGGKSNSLNFRAKKISQNGSW
ncbi:uncharacterized protein DEA37_0008599 [Paragonimus westermani]|uniref:Reverse transcriptase/retrotransposon-derived protein RNase H-like domain-containing protein n=1 Tax=Paragonimus westermani TaxID=34504 RepID=A0A5J4NYD9_9TREM|nr:uncharacterized protein DEA37_0008599 [Paragonimus westermani]